MKIESKDRNINDLLNSGYYVIPRFQRPYSWDNENISDFWNDTIISSNEEYFIGSMVVYTISDRKLGVVDGQQRLTTIMILLSAVRDALDSEGFSSQANGLHKLIERENIEDKKEFVLQTETSYPYFQDVILSRDDAEITHQLHKEEEQIKAAHEIFSKYVNDIIASHKGNPTLSKKKQSENVNKDLIKIRDTILSLKAILITLDSEDDAYIIFETLNTRGKDLNLADLVKNHFTKILKTNNKGLDHTKIKWNKVRETIEGTKNPLEIDTFIYHYWLSRYDYSAAKKIFKEFRKIITLKNASQELANLIADAERYRTMHEPGYRKWDKNANDAKSALHALGLFRVQQQAPCVLSLICAYDEKRLKISQLIQALGDIEKFHFLFTAITSQRSSGGISGMYASLARQFTATKNAESATPILRELRAKLKERVPSETEFEALFPSLIYTNTISKQRSLAKYVLSRLGRTQGHAYTADIEDLTIEHLYPQSGINETDWSEDVVGQLGNLILVSKEVNEKLKNKSFEEKKKILAANKCRDLLPDYFWSTNDLKPELITRRTKELSKIAFGKTWRI